MSILLTFLGSMASLQTSNTESISNSIAATSIALNSASTVCSHFFHGPRLNLHISLPFSLPGSLLFHFGRLNTFAYPDLAAATNLRSQPRTQPLCSTQNLTISAISAYTAVEHYGSLLLPSLKPTCRSLWYHSQQSTSCGFLRLIISISRSF